MLATASPARVTAILAGVLGFALLSPGGASLIGRSVFAAIANPIVSVVDLAEVQLLLAQADDLAPPSSDAIVTTPPPAQLAENVPPPLPGYAWDPGHWTWDGGQYVWEPGKVHYPTDQRCDLHAQLLATLADGPGLTAAGAGEPRARASRVRDP
jgi:hypothetical protein